MIKLWMCLRTELCDLLLRNATLVININFHNAIATDDVNNRALAMSISVQWHSYIGASRACALVILVVQVSLT